MDTQKKDYEPYKENADKNDINEMFPKGPLEPILGAPKQYEPPYRGRRVPTTVIDQVVEDDD